MSLDETATRRHENLDRLCCELSACVPPPAVAPTINAQKLAAGLPLAHATSHKNIEAICDSGHLKSMQTLIDEGLLNLRPDCAEAILGTVNAVFFYVGGFSYPATTFGFLFKSSLEAENQSEGSATPFDSGGLVKYFQWPNKPAETPLEFFTRHELPIPKHREYLSLSMDNLYAQPNDYLDPSPVGLKANPIGLAGGDPRRCWTHEVRIPGSVALRSPQLLAVFAPKARVGALPQVRSLFRWCLSNRVDREYFDDIGGDEFSGLRSACLDYLRERIY